MPPPRRLLLPRESLSCELLSSSFHVNTYFERIRDSLFNQHVLENLSGLPVVELERIKNEDEKLIDKVALLKQAGALVPGLVGLPSISESRVRPVSISVGFYPWLRRDDFCTAAAGALAPPSLP